jgi:hypothetical protein
MTMKRLYAAAMILILLLSGTACRGTVGAGADNSPSPGVSENPSPASPTVSDSAAGESIGTDNNVIMLEGTIGGLPVHMSLTITGGTVAGSYYYDNVRKELTLEGSTEADRMLSMDEYDENGELTGRFDGWYTRGIRITGTWTNAKTDKILEFSLKVIGGVPASAVWAGEWQRMDFSMFESATLVIFNETKSGFEFQIDAASGAHVGYIDGAAVIDGKTAYFKAADEDETFPAGAEITFDLKDGIISVTANSAANGYGGLGVGFDGRYTKNALPKDTLLSQGFVSTEAEHDAFKAMVGDDYELFLNTAHLGYEEEDIDGYGARVYRWFVRGVAMYHTSIVMFLPDGRLCAGVFDPENDIIKVYTDAGYITAVPETVWVWIANLQEALGLTADLPQEFMNTAKN